MGRRSGIVALLVLGLLACDVLAHDGLDARLVRADERVADAPDDPRPLLARASLHRIHEDPESARADLLRADALRAGEALPGLLAEQLWVAQAFGLEDVADELLTARLAEQPADGEAWILAGELLEARGAWAEAADAYARAFTRGGPCTPDLVAAAAACAGIAGRRDQALALLDQGLERLGPVPALVLSAVRLERERDRPDAALVRLSPLRASSPGQEEWLALEGDLLWQDERPVEARAVWTRARDLHHARSLRRRASRSGLELARHLDACLAAPAPAPGAPSAAAMTRPTPPTSASLSSSGPEDLSP
jgi:tetratricopeptide (TPR) repeat protein